jgi:hypothetical protein
LQLFTRQQQLFISGNSRVTELAPQPAACQPWDARDVHKRLRFRQAALPLADPVQGSAGERPVVWGCGGAKKSSRE